MNRIALCYSYPGDGEFVESPASFEDLMRRLDMLGRKYCEKAGMPFGVDLIKDNGRLCDDPSTAARLCVGLGDGEWLLLYFPGDDAGPVLNSLGDDQAAGCVRFFFGDSTRLSRKYLVARELAVIVIRTWFEEGRLSDAIRWTEQIY